MNERYINDRRFLFQWVRATWIGWVLGLLLIIVLALAGEAIGIGGAQVLVGAGMGAGIGLLQGRAMRGVIHKSAQWFWSCVGGLAAPFLMADIAKTAGWSSAYSLHACIGVGGIIVGTWQALILRPRFHNTRWWVVSSTLGWVLAGGAAGVADWLSRWQPLRGVWGAVAYLGIVAGGGLMLGVATGVTLVWKVRHKPAV